MTVKPFQSDDNNFLVTKPVVNLAGTLVMFLYKTFKEEENNA